jgi:hypothetical protein
MTTPLPLFLTVCHSSSLFLTLCLPVPVCLSLPFSPCFSHTLFVGSSITDTYTGSSYLDGDPNATESYFNKHHNYGLLWEPGEYVRWYLDDVLLFEVDKEALRAQVGVWVVEWAGGWGNRGGVVHSRALAYL